MKKKLLVLLMLGAFVGQVQGAENPALSPQTLGALREYKEYIDSPVVKGLMSEGQEILRKRLSKALENLNVLEEEATRNLVENIKDFVSVIEQAFSKKVSTERAVGKLSKQKTQEDQSQSQSQMVEELRKLCSNVEKAVVDSKKMVDFPAQKKKTPPVIAPKKPAMQKAAEEAEKAAEILQREQEARLVVEKAEQEQIQRKEKEEKLAEERRIEREKIAESAKLEELRQKMAEELEAALEAALLEEVIVKKAQAIAAEELETKKTELRIAEQQKLERENQERVAVFEREEAAQAERVAKALVEAEEKRKALRLEEEKRAADEEIDFAALLGDGAADEDASGIDFAALLGDGAADEDASGIDFAALLAPSGGNSELVIPHALPVAEAADVELKMAEALETLLSHITAGESNAAVVAQIPGFLQLSSAMRNYLTPDHWDDKSPRYYIALIAVQQVINYFYGQGTDPTGLSRRLGNAHFDKRDVVNAHFNAMYQQMLYAGQIETELDLHNAEIQADIQKAVTAITDLNRNFRESAGQGSLVLKFEDVLGSSGRPGPSIGEVTLLQPGSEIGFGGAPDSRGEASGWQDDFRSHRMMAAESFERVDHIIEGLIPRIYRDLILARHSQDFKAVREIPERKESLASYVQQHRQIFLGLTQAAIERIIIQSELPIIPEIGSVKNAAGIVAREIQELAGQAGIAMSDSDAKQLHDRFVKIVNLVQVQNNGLEDEYVSANTDDESQPRFLEIFINELLRNELENSGLLAEYMNTVKLTQDQQAAVIQFVSALSARDQATAALWEAHAHGPAFNLIQDANRRTVIEGMPELTEFLLSMGEEINSKARLFSTAKINLLHAKAAPSVLMELRRLKESRHGKAVSKDEIKSVISELYSINGIRISILDALSKAVWTLQFSDKDIYVNPDELLSPASSVPLPLFPIGSESTIARVLKEYQQQQARGGLGIGLTDIIEENGRSLQAELASMKRADTMHPGCPFNVEEIQAIVSEKAREIRFADAGDIGYLVGQLYELHIADPMFQ